MVCLSLYPYEYILVFVYRQTSEKTDKASPICAYSALSSRAYAHMSAIQSSRYPSTGEDRTPRFGALRLSVGLLDASLSARKPNFFQSYHPYGWMALMLMNACPVKRDKVGRVREHGHERQTSQKKNAPAPRAGAGVQRCHPRSRSPGGGCVGRCYSLVLVSAYDWRARNALAPLMVVALLPRLWAYAMISSSLVPAVPLRASSASVNMPCLTTA